MQALGSATTIWNANALMASSPYTAQIFGLWYPRHSKSSWYSAATATFSSVVTGDTRCLCTILPRSGMSHACSW